MENITTSKKGVNWISDSEVDNKKLKRKNILKEVLTDNPQVNDISEKELVSKCDELLTLTSKYYENNIRKEVSDIIVHLELAKREFINLN